MKRLFTALFLLNLCVGFTFAQNWQVDMTHSTVGFEVTHMMVSTTEGRFQELEGTVTASKEDLSDLEVDVTIFTKSIDTDNEQRDEHLRGPDFFDVANYPEIKFRSTKVMSKNGKLYIVGNLTIKAITKQINLEAVPAGIFINDPWGNTKTGLKATGTINRQDFEMSWSKTLEVGGLVISDEVELIINVELNQVK